MTQTLEAPSGPVKMVRKVEGAEPGIYPWEILEGRYAGRMGVYVPPTYMTRLQQIPGALYSKADEVWTLPKAWPAVLALATMKRDTHLPLRPHPALKAWVGEQAKHWEALRALSAKTSPKGQTEDGFFHHQEDDAEWFAYGGGDQPMAARLLLNETGTGKTVSVLRGIQRLDILSTGKPVLIVAPKKTMRLAWADDIEEFLPEAKAVLIRGTATQRRKAIEQIKNGEADIGIIGWEALRTHTRYAATPGHALKKCEACGGPKQSDEESVPESKCQRHEKELNEIDWGLIVADELHRSMNNTSQVTMALWGLARGAPHALRWGLTGTLISRRVEQTWSALHYADAEAWPVKSSWTDYYAQSGYNLAGFFETQGFKPEREAEFQEVFSAITRRRLKAEVLDLPPLLMGGELRRECEMPKDQAHAYKQMRDEMILKAKEGLLVAQNPMVQVGRLSMLASATGYPDPEWEKQAQAVLAENAARAEKGLPMLEVPPVQLLVRAPSGKIDVILDDLEDGEFDGEQVAFAFVSRKVLRLVEAELVNRKPEVFENQIAVIAGDLNDQQNDIAVYDFQNGRKRFVFYTYAAGGTGVTLTAASTLARVERSWSPILWKQGLDRVHRIGSEQHTEAQGRIRVLDYITTGTVEEKQLDRHGENAMLLESLVHDNDKLLSLLA
jgi:SNF2 family DNA or RNA helicase